MSLFSDVDWIVILGVAAFLLFGPENRTTLRTLGRWYARATNLKRELLGEVAKTAGIPTGTGSPGRVRDLLLGEGGTASARPSEAPLAVATPPATVVALVAVLPPVATAASPAAIGPGVWSFTGIPVRAPEVRFE